MGFWNQTLKVDLGVDQCPGLDLNRHQFLDSEIDGVDQCLDLDLHQCQGSDLDP